MFLPFFASAPLFVTPISCPFFSILGPPSNSKPIRHLIRPGLKPLPKVIPSSYPGCHKVQGLIAEFDQYFLEPAPDTLHPKQIRSEKEIEVEMYSEKLYIK